MGTRDELRRVYRLERVAGEVAKALIVHEQVEESIDPEHREYKVGCLELLVDSDTPWTWLDGSAEGDAIRICFPSDEYENMPPFLDLEKPKKPSVGQTWRMLSTDRTVAAAFIVSSIDTTNEPVKKRWKHGDIVQAKYEDNVYVARVIRETENGDVLVHWLIDDKFSEISMDDILEASTREWTREKVDADVEIEF